MLENFRMTMPNDIFFLSDDADTHRVFKSIYNDSLWEEWTDASAKDAPPPDFYNDTQHLMLEVMRVDDHGFKKKEKSAIQTWNGSIR